MLNASPSPEIERTSSIPMFTTTYPASRARPPPPAMCTTKHHSSSPLPVHDHTYRRYCQQVVVPRITDE